LRSPASPDGRTRRLLLGTIVPALLFAAGSTKPYRLESDAAYQAKTVQQFLAGRSPLPNVLVTADPDDLARDVQGWIGWWPPSFPTLLTPILAAGVPIGVAARLIAFGATALGTTGWLVCATELTVAPKTGWVVLTLASYAIVASTPTTTAALDVLSFSCLPWCYVWALRLTRPPMVSRRPGIPAVMILMTLLGSVYVIKYSALFGAGALALYVASELVQGREPGRTRGMLLVVAGIGAFVSPALLLTLVNRAIGSGEPGEVLARIGHAATPLDVLASAGRGFSGAYFGIGDGLDRAARSLSAGDAETAVLWRLILGIPALLLLGCVLLGCRARLGRRPAILAGLTAMVPIVCLGCLHGWYGYPFTVDALRHVRPYWVFLELVSISMLVSWGSSSSRTVRLTVLLGAVYLVAPNVYSAYKFLRYDVGRWGAEPYRASDHRLWVPTLATRDVTHVLDAVQHAIRSRDDVVVIAAPWLGMEAWLEIPNRILPLTNFWQPLCKTHGRDGADFFASSPFRSSRALRVVLVASDLYALETFPQDIARLTRRFPQARTWMLVRAGVPGEAAAVLVADLAAEQTALPPAAGPRRHHSCLDS
jgi:hypothetical protein